MTSPRTGPRRLTLLLAALLALALIATACGDSGDDGGGDASATTAPGAAEETDAPSDGDFPVEIEHAFGSTTISDEPQRVLSLGYQEHDGILALGVAPVGVRYWFGDEDDVIFPWAEEAAGDADPEVLNMPYGELNYEAIAALRPDVIMGIYSGITEEEYATLSEIAPVVAQPGDYPTYGVPWQVSLEVTGRALGRSDLASTSIEELEARFDQIAADHPEWEGTTVAVTAARGEQTLATFAATDPRTRFFTSLGFEPIPEIDELAGEQFYAEYSAENMSIIDGGLIVWDQLTYVEGGRATIESNPLAAQLQSMQEGRAIYMEGDVEAAFGFNSVLSIPYVLDAVVPMLEAAMDGDPATTS